MSVDTVTGCLVPQIILPEVYMTFLKEKYISPRAEMFFSKLDIDLKIVEEIPIEKSISDLDFKELKMEYYYSVLLHDIWKINNKLQFKIKYAITFDSALKNEKIKVGGTVIFYWIYIDFNEMIVFLRDEKIKGSFD